MGNTNASKVQSIGLRSSVFVPVMGKRYWQIEGEITTRQRTAGSRYMYDVDVMLTLYGRSGGRLLDAIHVTKVAAFEQLIGVGRSEDIANGQRSWNGYSWAVNDAGRVEMILEHDSRRYA
jgi:hypothetical protein